MRELLCILLVGALATACTPETDSDVHVSVELSPSPLRVGDAEVSVLVTDASGAALSGASVRIEGNMNHAGMVPEFADATETEPGRYLAGLELTMAGDWFLVVTVEAADGTRYEEILDLPGVARAGGG